MRWFVLTLVVLSACQFGPVTTVQPKPMPELYVGTTALEVSFDGNSQNDVFMCNEANVFVNLKNTGAFDIEQGAYSFILEEQVFRPINERRGSFSLQGRSEFLPSGSFDQLALRLKSLTLPENLESYSSPLIFQACYRYRTTATVDVCIDPDVRNLNPRKVCSASEVSLSGGQGGPLAVSRVEPFILQEGRAVRPSFVVYLQHVGTGQVVSGELAESACGRDARGLMSYAGISVELQGQRLECSDDDIKIEQGSEAKVVCQGGLYEASLATFTTPLQVELDYGYISTSVLPMSITRLPGQEACKN